MRPADGGLREGRLYFRSFLGRTGSHSALGARRHELVTDALRSRYGLSLRAGNDPHERLLARSQPIRHGAAVYERHPGAAHRLASERHLHGDRQQDEQDRLATPDALSHGWRRRIDRDCRRPPAAWRARRQFRGARRQDRGGAVEVQTGFGADAPAMVYEVDGDQYIAIVTGGNSIQGSAFGDALWAFSLKGQLGPLWPPPPPGTVAGPGGAVADGVNKVKIGDSNVEYAYWPARTRVKAGTTLTFTNVGDIPHTATAFDKGKVGDWDTGALSKGESKQITFKEPGIYFYICAPHPWMYGQVIVE